MELREALSQISEIRQQMARGQVFRGYRSTTTAFSALVAIAAAALQALLMREPAKNLPTYLILWVGAAIVSLAVVGAEIFMRARRSGSPLQKDMSVLAIEQFVPCLVAGGMLTFVLARFAPAAVWMLPGLWAILFGLGIFASCRVLPRGTFWAAGWYLLAGLVCLVMGQGEAALHPWAMAIPFGGGQLLISAILYWQLERGIGGRDDP
jgi:hypothetical protein